MAQSRQQIKPLSRLSVQLLLWFLLIALMPAGLIAFTTFQFSKNAISQEVVNNLANVARRQSDQVLEHLRNKEEDATTLARNPALVRIFDQLSGERSKRGAQARISTDEIRSYLTYFQQAAGYQNVLLVSLDGTVLFSSGTPALEGINLKTDEEQDVALSKVFDQTITLIGPQFSDFGERTGKFYVSAPVWQPKVGLLGTIILQVDLSDIFTLINDYSGLGKTGETVMAVLNGNEIQIVAPTRHVPEVTSRRILLDEHSPLPMQKALQGIKGQGVMTDYRGREVLAVWRYLPLLQAGLVVKFDVSEAEEPILALRYHVGALGAVCLLGASFLAFSIARSISQPIDQLTHMTEQLAQGGAHDFLEIRSGNEIGRLARSFNRMAGELEQRDQRIRELQVQRFQALVRNIPGVTFRRRWDDKHTLIFVSDPVETVTGYPAEDFLQENPRSFKEIIHPQDRAWVRQAVLKAVESHQGWEIEYRIFDRVGNMRWVLERGQASYLEGEPTFLDGIILDITDSKTAAQELLKARVAADAASEAKSDFLANMSHEIRTPMNAIIGLTHLALQTELTDKQRDYLSKVDSSAHSLLHIINDILDFSKIEAGKLDMERVSFRLDEVLSNVSTLLAIKAESKNLELLVSCAPDVPQDVVGDPLRLGQVLINLTNNAIKFTDQGEVTIRIELNKILPDDEVELCFFVTDSGIGMSCEQQSRLFKSFSQADTSTTRKYGGTGLGLAISKSLVEMMDGEIGVTSAVGEGSTFQFAARFGLPEEGQGLDLTPPPVLQGMKVLVVDDNAMARQVLTEMAESFSFDTSTASSGAEALEQLRQASPPFKLVLLDFKMPHMNGAEVTAKIRAEIKPAPVIIMVTNYSKDEVRAQAEKAGIDGFLAKPVTSSILFDGIVRSFGAGKLKPIFTPQSYDRVSFGGQQILLVEDNEINQQVAGEILQSLDLEVTVANNGREALEFLAERTFELVLMDIQMPEMDGYETTAAIRSNAALKHLPVIAMTAHAMAGDRKRCLDAGMDDHVTKPIKPAVLIESLQAFLSSERKDNMTFQEATFPLLEGIDTVSGLGRLGGNRALYRKLLIQFHDKYAQSVGELRECGQDAKRMNLLAHTLKGVAANLGITEVASVAEKLEQAADDDGISDFGPLIVALESVLSPVLQGLSSLSLERAQEGAKEPFEAAQFEQDVDRLKAALEESSTEAEDLLLKMRKQFSAGGFESYFLDIGKALDEFDFDRALEVLASMPSVSPT